jgi:hypothetical protein
MVYFVFHKCQPDSMALLECQVLQPFGFCEGRPIQALSR